MSRGCACVSPDLSVDSRSPSRYGRWDLLSEGPARTAMGPKDLPELLNTPHPHWAELTVAARARLATAGRPRMISAAPSGDARPLARLAYSTETFSGATTGLAILMAETRLREELNRLEPSPGCRCAISGRALGRRAVRCRLRGVLFPIAPSSMRKRLFGSPDLRFGRCQGPRGRHRREPFSATHPRNPDVSSARLSTDYAELDRILDASLADCRLQNERRAWAASLTMQPFKPIVRLIGETLASATALGLEIAYGNRDRQPL